MPYPLLWLRYSAFVVLYPLGVASGEPGPGPRPDPGPHPRPHPHFEPLHTPDTPSPQPSPTEMAMVWLALPTIRKNRPLSITMPNAWNFALDYYVGCFLGIACYVPGLPELYMHMVKQHKKVLHGGGGGGGSGRGRASGSSVAAKGKAKAT